MRFLATLLIGCIMFLSCFPGLAHRNTVVTAKNGCCKKMKMVCHQSSKEKSSANDCEQPGCSMMFSCSLCGFFVKEPLALQPVYADLLPKPVAHYKIDNLVGYHPDNWKPPQSC